MRDWATLHHGSTSSWRSKLRAIYEIAALFSVPIPLVIAGATYRVRTLTLPAVPSGRCSRNPANKLGEYLFHELQLINLIGACCRKG